MINEAMLETLDGRYELSTEIRLEMPLHVSNVTAGLIRAGVSKNTLKAYRHASKKVESWLAGRVLDDGLLSKNITNPHQLGNSPATMSQAVAAVKWTAKNAGRGQVDGLVWNDVTRICAHAEASKTLAGLRDAAMIQLMSDCLLRISEVIAVNVEDVGKVLIVESSKTDQTGRGEQLYIGEHTRLAIRKYREAGNVESGALFRRARWHKHITPNRLSVNSARDAIKWWAEAAGVEGFISGHSHWRKPGRLLWICTLPGGGVIRRCRCILPVRHHQNAALLRGSNMGSDRG